MLLAVIPIGLAVDWVAIPAGSFSMGCDRVECRDNEGPEHLVSLSAFRVARTETTQGQWDACVGAGACARPYTGYDPQSRVDWPVVGVTRLEAQAYCEWSGGRLPTEAEWEYAARGTDGRVFPWGPEAPDCARARLQGCGAPIGPVAMYPAGNSPFDLADMVGNAWEIVSDWFAPDYYGESPAENPTGSSLEMLVTVRGPSTWSQASARATLRMAIPVAGRSALLGFRCASGAE
ncbi:MAG: SUMF1/EgtB/PvdO family nonheme iron enzyme [Deltaproteobacteria bacterium]|nr:SUMF1/EgtB/PvdO family nonheme iron enzyme [Deltaproteobacteria bacterium]